MNINFLLLIFALVFIYLIYDYIVSYKQERILDRLNAGFDSVDQDNPSLWAGAVDLLQLSVIRNLIYESVLIRKYDILLKRSGLKVSLLQALSLLVFISIVSAISAYYFFNAFYVVIIALVATPLAVWFVVSLLAKRQQKKHDNQLPALITGLLASMRAGGTPLQALQAIGKNSENPIRDSIAAVMNNLQIGRSPNLVWQEWATFWDTKNTRLLSTGIRLKWESGGQMSNILEHILETIEFGRRIELRVSTVTAQAKLSAIVLSLLPPGLAFLQYSYRPDLMESMYNDELGKQLFIYAAISTVIGFIWLLKIAKLKS